MALVVPPRPVAPLRRSPRSAARRQTSSPASSRSGRIATSLPGSSEPPVLGDASTLRTRSCRDSNKPRSRVSDSTATRHRSKSVSGAALSVRAGTKRKRAPTSSDQSDQPRYELAVPATHPDKDVQTPRQLRYVKRQRLSLSDHTSPRSSENVENAPHPSHSLPPAPEQASPASEVRDAVPEDEAACDGPVFTPLPRLPTCWRARTPDATEPTLWKIVCQERVEHLKRVYRDVFRAVVHAEAAAAVPVAPPAPQPPTETPTSPGETEFELYTPDQFAAEEEDADADGDIDMDSSEEADADGEGDDEDDGEQYERVMVLDTPQTPAASLPRLPRLSSIRVMSLKPHPPSTRDDGAPFIGRGTPADRKRLADWATPAEPLPQRALSWTPEPLFFTPDMVPPSAPQLDISTASGSVGSQPHVFGMDVDTDPGLLWLDPALHAESVSPSPSPSPSVLRPDLSPFANISPSDVLTPFPWPGNLAFQPGFGGMPGSAAPPSSTACPVHGGFLECLQAPGGCPGPVFPAPSASLPPVLPLALPSSSSTAASLTPAFAAPSSVFPNQELAQFVRSHLSPGSVTLSHALG